MNARSSVFGLALALGFAAWASVISAQGQNTPRQAVVLFSTGFEAVEGYEQKFSLGGQNAWVNLGSGGNGLLTNFLPGFGQSAYVGFFAPSQKEETLHLLRPVDLAPIPTNLSLVTFSVTMQLVDSSNGHFDDFRWSVYNTNGTRLFSIDFENSSFGISYGLDDQAGFVPAGLAFDHQGSYDLVITMNFARNLWSASLNEVILANSKPITTMGSALNLGDIDVVWVVRNPGNPGDNFMVFDNYTIVAENKPSIPPSIVPQGFLNNRQFGLRFYGEQGLNYVVEASADLVRWEPIKVITAPGGGVFDFQDPDASRFPHRYYRAWHRP